MAAPPQAPSALSYPTAGSSDPFSASFYANQAALQFSEENVLASDQKATRDANSTYAYNRGVDARAEPLALTKNQNAANTAGLAESGVLAKTQGQTQTGYAQKEGRLGETRRNAVEKYQQSENTAKGNFALGTNKNVAAETERVEKEQASNPSLPEGSKAANPGGQRTVYGPPQAGGVVPYTETSSRGVVTVGKTPQTEARERQMLQKYREEAAKKAKGAPV